MSKPQTAKSAEDLFNEATEGRDLSSGDLSLLTAGLMALRKTHDSPLNEVELKALSGMISYVAYNQKVDETTVCEILTAHYGVAEVKALPARLYQSAIEYLVDLKINNIMN